jgi:hypothetical protein
MKNKKILAAFMLLTTQKKLTQIRLRANINYKDTRLRIL